MMALFVVATPIGNPDDISLRAIDVLKAADLVIGEERREVLRLLKRHGIEKPIEVLNEHSRNSDHLALVMHCQQSTVALISDCGTPGFCDPGADLVRACRRQKIPVHPVPGASSLMAFLSSCGESLGEFVFLGFLSNKKELREPALKRAARERRPCILMDTPYRLERLIDELSRHCPDREIIVGLDLTAETEEFLEGRPTHVLDSVRGRKAEFILLLKALA